MDLNDMLLLSRQPGGATAHFYIINRQFDTHFSNMVRFSLRRRTEIIIQVAGERLGLLVILASKQIIAAAYEPIKKQ